MKKTITVTAGLLAVAAALFMNFRVEASSVKTGEETGRAILYQVTPDVYEQLSGGAVTEQSDPAWNTYTVYVEDQFDHPDSMTVTFTRDEDHLVTAYGDDGSFNSQWTFGSGTHTIPFSPEDTFFHIAVHDEDETGLDLREQGGEPEESGPYAGKYLSVLGDSITAYYGYVEEDFYAPNTPDEMPVTDMWWYEMARLTGMNICTINASGGSGVTQLDFDERFMGNGDRSRHLSNGGQDPDVICVLLGINDLISQVNIRRLRREYDGMVQIIQDEYPEAEIWLCTYYEIPGYLQDLEGKLNQVIRSVAEARSVNVLELDGSGLGLTDIENRFKDYDPDSGNALHPNANGQKILGRWAAEKLLEAADQG